MIICTFEDRATDIIGLQLLICSLARHLPEVPVAVFCPVADDAFRAWLKDHPQVTLNDDQRLKGMGWDVKPTLLRTLLDNGHDEVVWMDSDIIVTKDFRPLLPPDDRLVVAHEPALTRFGVRQRTLGWSLSPARDLPGLNTCLLRVAPRHAELIDAWQHLLAHPDYRAARSLPFQHRAPHLLGDQDVLMGLLGAEQYSNIEVCILRCGPHIIQHFGTAGYPPLQRLTHLVRGMPPLIHCQGNKPWRFSHVPDFTREPKSFFTCLYLDTSPYSHYARHYRAKIPVFPGCLEIRTTWGKLSNTTSLGLPCLRGITLATAASGLRGSLKMMDLAGRARRKIYNRATSLLKLHR